MVAKVLEHPTLVLNRNWQPVNVATVVRRSFCCGTRGPRVDPADYRLYTWADWSELRRTKASSSSRPCGCGCACRR